MQQGGEGHTFLAIKRITADMEYNFLGAVTEVGDVFQIIGWDKKKTSGLKND